jgi:hypothetical protein
MSFDKRFGELAFTLNTSSETLYGPLTCSLGADEGFVPMLCADTGVPVPLEPNRTALRHVSAAMLRDIIFFKIVLQVMSK